MYIRSPVTWSVEEYLKRMVSAIHCTVLVKDVGGLRLKQCTRQNTSTDYLMAGY